ncbi:MAG: DUF255 domain-containing protein [Gammaproteobacteria bacterium]|nr:DUF255 domain-containing protein [Gammaproteobacteria bacterium]
MKNHLIQSNNPILNKHSESKVNWYFWDPRVMALAQEEGRPVFMAVITAHCRGCEVMMGEYFENTVLSEAINQHYTAILVDANESPALYRLVMEWYRLTHDDAAVSLPLMATFSEQFAPWELYRYVPENDSMDSFAARLSEHARVIDSRPDLVNVGNALYQRSLGIGQASGAQTPLTTEGLVNACEHLLEYCTGDQNADPSASAQLSCPTLEALLRMTYAFYHTPSLSVRCLEQVVDTADKLINRRLRDHINGGFFGASGLAQPHSNFIKNLDDNAQILSLLLHLYAITRQADFYDQSKALLDFIFAQMATGDGAYRYSLHENPSSQPGEHYLYSPDEVRQLLPREYLDIFSQMYGLAPLPDFSAPDAPTAADARSDSQSLPDDKPMALYERCRLDDLAGHHGISFQKCQSIIDRCIEVLSLNSRTRRDPLKREDKILTRANSLMISALVEAGWLFGDRIYYHYAEQLLDYIVKNLWVHETIHVGRVNHDRIEGYNEPSEVERYLLAPGNLDDYVYFLRAVLDCLSNDFRLDRLRLAERLARLIADNFYDDELGELVYQDRRCFTAAPTLRDIADGICPGSVPTALECFRRLGWMTGEERFIEISSRCSWDYVALAQSDPVRYASMLKNLTLELNPLIVLWFLYDETNTSLVHADRVPVFAGRTHYHRVSFSDLDEVAGQYDYKLLQNLAKLPRNDLQVVATRKDEILEVISELPDIHSLENQIKRANQVRL